MLGLVISFENYVEFCLCIWFGHVDFQSWIWEAFTDNCFEHDNKHAETIIWI